MNRSPQQQAIVEWGIAALESNERKSLIGNACAGSGKSTVAVELMDEALQRFPELAGQIAYLAFGKRNQRDMALKIQKYNLPPGAVNVQTFNAAGLAQCVYRGRKCSLDFRRSQDILEDLGVPKNWQWSLAELWQKLQEQGHGARDEYGVTSWPEIHELENTAITYDIDTKMPVRKKTKETWRKIDGWMIDLCIEHQKLDGVVTFSDQVWMPVARAALQPLKSYRLLVVDEFQDLNVIRRVFANLSTAVNTVSVFLGDRNQAIMGFAGADRQAFQSVIDSQPSGVDFLPLSWTFRCPPAIVKDAQLEVPEIECAPGLWEKCRYCRWDLQDSSLGYFCPNASCKAGLLVCSDNTRFGINETRPLHRCDFKPGDVILARNNRPLVDMFFKLLDKHTPVRFEGAEWAQKMLGLHKAFVRREDPQGLTAYRQGVYDEGGRRVKDLLDHEPPRKWKAAQTRDEYGAWVSLITYVMIIPQSVLDSALNAGSNPFAASANVGRNVDTVAAFLDAIQKNANEDSEDLRNSMVTLSTIHKAKGLEWDNVYWYGFDQLHPSKLATTAEELEQERNLVYVCKTRARRALYKVPMLQAVASAFNLGDEMPDDAGVLEDEPVEVKV